MTKIPNNWLFINEYRSNLINLFNNKTNNLGIIFLYKNFSIGENYKKIAVQNLKIIRKKKNTISCVWFSFTCNKFKSKRVISSN